MDFVAIILDWHYRISYENKGVPFILNEMESKTYVRFVAHDSKYLIEMPDFLLFAQLIILNTLFATS